MGGSTKAALRVVAEQGFTAVQLDATLSGVRPRELGRTARRELAVYTKRLGLAITGLDFMIPNEHYRDPAHMERAADSAVAACGLAAELGRVPVSLNIPADSADPMIAESIASAADQVGVCLAIHDEAQHAGLVKWLDQQGASLLTAGLDPAALLLSRNDPIKVAQSMGGRLGVARLSDARRGEVDAGRVPVGRGDLDLLAYRVSVDIAPLRRGPVVLDLRGLADPVAAARIAQTAWDDTGVNL